MWQLKSWRGCTRAASANQLTQFFQDFPQWKKLLNFFAGSGGGDDDGVGDENDDGDDDDNDDGEEKVFCVSRECVDHLKIV